jgi:hypothetical protein
MPDIVSQNESWRRVPGYPMYLVSDKGNVKSDYSNKILKPQIIRKYRTVFLYKDGTPNQVKVCRLVLSAFKGFPSDKLEAAHIDGDHTNDSITNLRWSTHEENMRDNVTNNAVAKGERNGSSKLTKVQVVEIKKLLGTMPKTHIAKLFGISTANVHHISTGKLWGWVNA